MRSRSRMRRLSTAHSAMSGVAASVSASHSAYSPVVQPLTSHSIRPTWRPGSAVGCITPTRSIRTRVRSRNTLSGRSAGYRFPQRSEQTGPGRDHSGQCAEGRAVLGDRLAASRAPPVIVWSDGRAEGGMPVRAPTMAARRAVHRGSAETTHNRHLSSRRKPARRRQ
jgi:hypothetical protein